MTKTEWIQQAMLHIGNYNASGREDTIAVIVKTADVLGKTAPWSDEPETARESFVRGTEVGHTEQKKVCAQILQSAGIGALVHHLGIVGWVVEDDAPFAPADSVAAAVKAEREACVEIADAEAKKYSEMFRNWEASGDCSAKNFHEAGGAAIVGREIRDAIRRRS